MLAETIPRQQLFQTFSILPFHWASRPTASNRPDQTTNSFQLRRKTPYFTGQRHPAIRLYLEQLHKTHCHQGVDYMRTLVQQQFAIVKLRTALRSIVSKCVTCRKRRAETLNPIMSDLPRERLAFQERPFTNT